MKTDTFISYDGTNQHFAKELTEKPKEVRLECDIFYDTNYIRATYYSEGHGQNRLQDLHLSIWGQTYPLDIAEVQTSIHYKDLNKHVQEAIANSAETYWDELTAA